MKIDWELTEKSAKFIHHGECESSYSRGHYKNKKTGQVAYVQN